MWNVFFFTFFFNLNNNIISFYYICSVLRSRKLIEIMKRYAFLVFGNVRNFHESARECGGSRV